MVRLKCLNRGRVGPTLGQQVSVMINVDLLGSDMEPIPSLYGSIMPL